MSVRYRFTIRPASMYHCPDGWTEIVPLIPDQQWNYGTVEYPEPLTFKVADHWSLAPDSGPRVVGMKLDGEKVRFANTMEDARQLAHDLAVGLITPDELRAMVADKAADYGVDLTIEIDENPSGQSRTLWRDA